MASTLKGLLNILTSMAQIDVFMHGAAPRRFSGNLRISLYLDHISFKFCILHYVMLTPLLSWLVIRYAENLTFPAALAMAMLTAVVCLVLSSICTPVDRWSHRLSKVFAGWVLIGARNQPASVKDMMSRPNDI